MAKTHWDDRRVRAQRMSLARSRHLEREDMTTSDRRRAARAWIAIFTPHDLPRPGRRNNHQRKREARYEPLGTF